MTQYYFKIEIVFDDLKSHEFSDGLKVISNEGMDFNDPKEIDDLQVFEEIKGNFNWKYGL